MEIITAAQAAEEAKGLTFEIVWTALMESRQQMEKSNEEFNKRMQESDEKMQKQMQESKERTDKILDELSKNIGGVNNSLGDITESMFSGKLWDKFEEYGIPVTSQSIRRTFRDGKKNMIAEADIFIENGQYAIPVEVKTKPTEKDVDEHIMRIEAIRLYFDARDDKRKLLGAIAGGIVSEKVLKYAQTNGLFVLVQSGDSVTIADTPEGFKAREW